jgi:hypothetical protein
VRRKLENELANRRTGQMMFRGGQRRLALTAHQRKMHTLSVSTVAITTICLGEKDQTSVI